MATVASVTAAAVTSRQLITQSNHIIIHSIIAGFVVLHNRSGPKARGSGAEWSGVGVVRGVPSPAEYGSGGAS